MNGIFENAMSLQHRLDDLRNEHRHIDDSITRLCHETFSDDLTLRRLKKHKLIVRDRIAIIERMLSPDLPA